MHHWTRGKSHPISSVLTKSVDLGRNSALTSRITPRNIGVLIPMRRIWAEFRIRSVDFRPIVAVLIKSVDSWLNFAWNPRMTPPSIGGVDQIRGFREESRIGSSGNAAHIGYLYRAIGFTQTQWALLYNINGFKHFYNRIITKGNLTMWIIYKRQSN